MTDTVSTEERTTPLYPEIEVQLTGKDGNAFGIIVRVMRAMREAGVPVEEREKYSAEARSADYNNVIRTSAKWVEIY